MIAPAVYILCALAATVCAVMLLQSYRRTRFGLLWWSGMCFISLAAANTFLVLDLVVFVTQYNLLFWRNFFNLLGVSILLYTSELEEVQLACDRAVVIFGGRVVDILPAAIADEAALTRAAYGLPRDGAAGTAEARP